MANIENSYKWTFTSTGTSTDVYDCKGYAQGLTFGYETTPDCTASIQVLHRMGTPSGPFSVLSTTVLSTGAFTTDQYMGPLEFVTLRVTDKTANSTSIVTVWLKGNG